ncbi:unnamed protein product [Linum tenue]|uniref:SAP30-binding protein n=1 Tax=Linum tenue TaxID=586396 RepID=A0AAV0PXH3_9ROSI|nr:unnamed protein product [Linum tenue]
MGMMKLQCLLSPKTVKLCCVRVNFGVCSKIQNAEMWMHTKSLAALLSHKSFRNDAGREEMIPGPSQPFGSEASQLTDHSEAPQSDNMNNSSDELEAVKVEDSTGLTEGKADRLDKFLPPPPKEKCPSELQNRITKFITLKKIGRSFNAEVRNRKDYRNPDFLLDAVRYQDIDQIGTCFSKDVFDPHGYDKSDFYDEIAFHVFVKQRLI